MKCKDIVDPPLVCSKCKAPIEGSYYPLDDGPYAPAPPHTR